MTKAIESRSQAFKRITNGIRNFVNHAVGAAKLILEAKQLEIWKEKYSSWQEYCEKEFGQSPRRSYQLLEIAGTIEEIESVKPFHTESGKNKAILNGLTSRQATELKGLLPEEKAKVFHLAIEAEGGKPPRPTAIASARSAAQLPPRRRSSFDPDPVKKNYDGAYSSEVDPADRIPKAAPGDVILARAVSLPVSTTDVFPQVFTFEVQNQDEKDSFRVLGEKILVKRQNKNGRKKIDMGDAIRQVCTAYKRVKGKNLSVKPADAAQLRRHLESGMELDEFIAVGEKAWASDGFWAKGQSHQLSTFVKHFGTIREEVSNNGKPKGRPSLIDQELDRMAKLVSTL